MEDYICMTICQQPKYDCQESKISKVLHAYARYVLSSDIFNWFIVITKGLLFWEHTEETELPNT